MSGHTPLSLEKGLDTSSAVKETGTSDIRDHSPFLEPIPSTEPKQYPESSSAREAHPETHSGWIVSQDLSHGTIHTPEICLAVEPAIMETRQKDSDTGNHAAANSHRYGGNFAGESCPYADKISMKSATMDDNKDCNSDNTVGELSAPLPLPNLLTSSDVLPSTSETKSEISLKGYMPFDPHPWAEAIAEHQAKTITNFHSITQALDSINAELQYIFSEFLTRQYEQIDETLKSNYDRILRQEQEQDRLQAQMMSFVDAMKNAFLILGG
ncbi:hypothetical protein EDD21DRAFT_82726 [Dissophora ornata]|nr:hypothetical protein EDD21DRAFT_82726 [Dissophora ornata]